MCAYNNKVIDYGTIALCNALLIKKNSCQKNVTLVSNDVTMKYIIKKYGRDLINYAFDNVILDDATSRAKCYRKFSDTRYSKHVGRYINDNQISVYNFTPYDETILIDADYLILDNTLDLVWGNAESFMCNRRCIDLDHKTTTPGFEKRLNDTGILMYWSTVMYFKKTYESQVIFDTMQFIKEHYDFYRHLYNFETGGIFRNDYALSIALHLANGMVEGNAIKSLPVDYMRVSNEFDQMHSFENGVATFTSEPIQGMFIAHTIDSNIHIMNKMAIVRNADKIIDYAKP
jgi:hypothetical protein